MCRDKATGKSEHKNTHLKDEDQEDFIGMVYLKEKNEDGWMGDTGASVHVTDDIKIL